MKTQIILSIFTAASASLCCITPVLAIVAGTSSLATSFSWLDPLRPYFISATFLVLGITWFNMLKSKKEDDCGCEPAQKTSFLKSKGFLSVVTILSLLLITFPSYSKFFFQNSGDGIVQQDQTKNKKIELTVNGMTCASCELHIESEVKKLPGVSFVKASYDKKSTTVEFDEQKVDVDKIIASINSTGYKVDQSGNALQQSLKGNCCTNGSCSTPSIPLPKEINENLIKMTDVNQIKKSFNQQAGKIKFVAILSSTCGWCLQGAESIQKTVLEKIADKNISVVIVWTNMLKADDKNSAYHAAALFNNKNVVQYFDTDNKFGDIVAKSLNSKGEKAWDIYMFFDKDTQWNQNFPRPFDYAHQLSATNHLWVDKTKYFCGADLTKRLADITASL